MTNMKFSKGSQVGFFFLKMAAALAATTDFPEAVNSSVIDSVIL